MFIHSKSRFNTLKLFNLFIKDRPVSVSYTQSSLKQDFYYCEICPHPFSADEGSYSVYKLSHSERILQLLIQGLLEVVPLPRSYKTSTNNPILWIHNSLQNHTGKHFSSWHCALTTHIPYTKHLRPVFVKVGLF